MCQTTYVDVGLQKFTNALESRRGSHGEVQKRWWARKEGGAHVLYNRAGANTARVGERGKRQREPMILMILRLFDLFDITGRCKSYRKCYQIHAHV